MAQLKVFKKLESFYIETTSQGLPDWAILESWAVCDFYE
jgi:hypothetical protein